MRQKDKLQTLPTDTVPIQHYSSPQYRPLPSSEPVLQLLMKVSKHHSHNEKNSEKKSNRSFHSLTPPLALPDLTQKPILKNIQKYMKLYFFFCPACFSFDTIDTKKQFCYCQSCASIWDIFSSVHHPPQETDTSVVYEALQTWYVWQYACLLTFIDNRIPTNECIIMMNDVSVQISTTHSKQSSTEKHAQIQLYPNSLIWQPRHNVSNILYHTSASKQYISNISLQDIHAIDYSNEIPLRTVPIHTHNNVLTVHRTKHNSILSYFFALHYLVNTIHT